MAVVSTAAIILLACILLLLAIYFCSSPDFVESFKREYNKGPSVREAYRTWRAVRRARKVFRKREKLIDEHRKKTPPGNSKSPKN